MGRGVFCQPANHAGGLVNDGEVQEEERRKLLPLWILLIHLDTEICAGMLSCPSAAHCTLITHSGLLQNARAQPRSHHSSCDHTKPKIFILPFTFPSTCNGLLRVATYARSYTSIPYPNSPLRTNELHPFHLCYCETTKPSPYTLPFASLSASAC